MEIWKDIIGYEGLYQVSNMGRVKSLARLKKNGCNSFQKIPEILRELRKDKGGYFNVDLWKDNKKKVLKVHRLVAHAFIPNPNNYPLVMHLDNNPSNNLLSNLQWGTQSQNMQHCVASGRKNSRNQYM